MASDENVTPAFTNRLAKETSPYLLQHKHNPVDWFPWGEEAFEKARRENKPLLISIGYSACHWCHVMERESFENPETARLINETVVPVKVDREERPDVDAIYMEACVAMTGQGGWPLNAFVTPDLKPFFVGTYFPPDHNPYGRPGFRTVLQRIREAWLTNSARIKDEAESIQRQFERVAQPSRREAFESGLLDQVLKEAAGQFDLRHGGFGTAPKFPPDQRLALLLAISQRDSGGAALQMVTRTLDQMAYGGMYDQLGGGFARYSVDAEWLIPHFEKMLYNQALLVPVYLDAYLVTGNKLYRRTAIETLDWVLRDMTAPEGVFYAALDADSEGEEGKYYVWTPAQVEQVLGTEEGSLFSEYYGVAGRGNFEHGTSVLFISVPPGEFAGKHGMSEDEWLARLEGMKAKMLGERAKRVPPGTDDKALTGWNGLMISALCRGYQVLGDERYRFAASAAALFILQRQSPGPGELLRNYCKGVSSIPAVLEDYSFFIQALVDLYETTFEVRYVQAARELADTMIAKFWDEENDVFYASAAGDASLISRPLDLHDGAIPSGAAVAAYGLLRLAALLEIERYARIANRQFESAGPQANRVPSAFATMLLAHQFAQPSQPQIVISGEKDEDGVRALVEAVYRTYLPFRTLAVARQETELVLPLTGGRISDSASAYVCRNFTCRAPVHTSEDLKAELRQSS